MGSRRSPPPENPHQRQLTILPDPGTHSLYVNGLGGRFEDHVVEEVVPYLMRAYSIRPERQAHALLGISAGGFGAMGMALKHRDIFGVVAILGGPLNILYYNCQG
jgi:S-formylglutathione hydrolase FrmB